MVALYAIGGARAETVIEKPSDESVSNQTMQADDDLTFTAANGVTYEINATLIYGSPGGGATPDLRLGFGEDGTARGQAESLGYSTADSINQVNGTLDQAANFLRGTATADRLVTLKGVYTGAGGSAAVYWSQNSASGSPVIVRAGSVLRYRPINDPAGGGGGGSTAWGDITDKPTFNLSWLDDVDTTGAIDGVVLKYDEADDEWQVATDNAGGEGSSGPVTLSAGDRERLDLAWWGVWALVGLALLALIAPAMYRLLDVRHGMGGRFERG